MRQQLNFQGFSRAIKLPRVFQGRCSFAIRRAWKSGCKWPRRFLLERAVAEPAERIRREADVAASIYRIRVTLIGARVAAARPRRDAAARGASRHEGNDSHRSWRKFLTQHGRPRDVEGCGAGRCAQDYARAAALPLRCARKSTSPRTAGRGGARGTLSETASRLAPVGRHEELTLCDTRNCPYPGPSGIAFEKRIGQLIGDGMKRDDAVRCGNSGTAPADGGN
jgi:hypothetical protein